MHFQIFYEVSTKFLEHFYIIVKYIFNSFIYWNN